MADGGRRGRPGASGGRPSWRGAAGPPGHQQWRAGGGGQVGGLSAQDTAPPRPMSVRGPNACGPPHACGPGIWTTVLPLKKKHRSPNTGGRLAPQTGKCGDAYRGVGRRGPGPTTTRSSLHAFFPRLAQTTGQMVSFPGNGFRQRNSRRPECSASFR